MQDVNRKSVHVKAKAEWYQKRLQILDNMQKGMGGLPEGNGLPGFNLKDSDSLHANNYVHYSVKFLVLENERLATYLYVPDNMKRKKISSNGCSF
ncbi:MAG: hypothetical protein ACRDE8_06805 [Ginsengibacter sp.]